MTGRVPPVNVPSSNGMMGNHQHSVGMGCRLRAFFHQHMDMGKCHGFSYKGPDLWKNLDMAFPYDFL